MRAASFRIKGPAGRPADVGVFLLPEPAGSDLDNVNRWRGQIGLPPLSEADLAGATQSIETSAGQAARLCDQVGQLPGASEKTRVLAAILRRDNSVWFFKMTGDDALVAEQKPAFIGFLKSVTFPAPSEKP
jgi:hypothetical protein